MGQRPRSSLVMPLLLAGWAQLAAQPAPPHGSPGLMVAPTRVVFDNRRRTSQVNFTNSGTGVGSYRLFLERMEMDENGGLQEVALEPRSGQAAFHDLVRFAPREVTLNPQETQVVRIQVRRPADLPPGEYRMHLLFQEAPPPEPEAGPGAPAPSTPAIGITALFGMAIPVIFRNSTTPAKVAISGMALDADRKHLRFRIERTGNQSVFGDLQAVFHPQSGKPHEVYASKGLAVYTPNAFRNFNLPLQPSPQGGGTLQVIYSAQPDEGGAILAEGSFEVH